MPTWSNSYIYPGGRDDPAIKVLESETPEDIFNERYAAVPRRKHGRVLPEFDMEIHVRHLDYDPQLGPVVLAVDPASHCYVVLFVQHNGLVTHVLDRVYMRNTIAEKVIPHVMANPLWQYVDERAGVIDRAGKTHPATYSQIEIWKRDAGVTLRPSRYALQADSVEALRSRLSSDNLMKEPLIYFNDNMTNKTSSDGSLAMDVLAEPYLWKWPERVGDKSSPKYPIDKNNDAMKALAYEIVDRYGIVLKKEKRTKRKKEQYWLAHSAMNKAANRYALQGTHTRQGKTYGGRALPVYFKSS